MPDLLLAEQAKLLTYPEVAEALRVSEMTVRRMVDRGDLAAIKVGPRMIRFDADEVRLIVRRGRVRKTVAAA